MENQEEYVRLLKENLYELELLTNNIYFGMQLCSFDSYFTIHYMSIGFEKLTGYTREEIDTIFQNRHICLIYPKDRSRVFEELNKQIKESNSFSLEYRIVRKDSKIVWVLDNGVMLRNGQIQCILTDITFQKEQEEALLLSEKRYEIALISSELTMFEYNIITGELIFFNGVAEMYKLPDVVPDGPETLIRRGIIEPASVSGYREMYKKIHEGVPKASCLITTKDAEGVLHDYELTLTSIFDSSQKPIRSIGVRKNVSQIMSLVREQEFGKTLVADRTFFCEADLTRDIVTDISIDISNRSIINDNPSANKLRNWVCDHLVYPGHTELFMDRLETSYLIEQFHQGRNLVEFSIKCKIFEDSYTWVQITIIMVRDDRTDALHARFYYMNINERKQKEIKANEEQQLYEAMVRKSLAAYEVNITRNYAIKGHEDWRQLYGIENNSSYSKMIHMFSIKAAHPSDTNTFANTFGREHVLKQFYEGKHKIDCQYRRKNANGDYKWVCCTLHLFEDPESRDVKGFSYAEDIDDQKQEELKLKFNAEHDLMTGLYNKTVTTQKIEKFLSSAAPCGEKYAFFMIDIDYFKNINDTFGHVHGDAILCELAGILKSVFKDGDIAGRIGGDEFCVFVTTGSSYKELEAKANMLCGLLHKSYCLENKNCTISASVGVAVYPDAGTTFNQLYCRADAALYEAKKNGRDTYRMA